MPARWAHDQFEASRVPRLCKSPARGERSGPRICTAGTCQVWGCLPPVPSVRGCHCDRRIIGTADVKLPRASDRNRFGFFQPPKKNLNLRVLLPGWDGTLVCGQATAFTPPGPSGWEFGTASGPRAKADGDYRKRTANPLGLVPTESAFVIEETGPLRHHGMGLPSRNHPPVGPSAGRRAAQSTDAAPCSTDRGAPCPPISVRTHPGSTEFTSTSGSSRANSRASALRAALLAPYPSGASSERRSTSSTLRVEARSRRATASG